MVDEQKKTSTSMIAGILFVISAAYVLLQLRYGINVWNIISAIAYAVIAFALLTKRRDIVLPVGLAAATLLFLRSNIVGSGITFIGICNILSFASAAIMGFVALCGNQPQKIKSIWFIPAALQIPVFLADLFDFFNWGYAYQAGLYLSLILITLIIQAASLLLTMMWVAYPDGIPKKVAKSSQSGENGDIQSGTPTEEMYCDMAKHVLLLLFTFGIWLLIWIYRVTGYTNNVEGEEDRDPTKKLLLCMFIPFYSIYWTYKTAQRIDKMAKSKEIDSDISTLCLILAIFVGIVPPILMQDKMNKIATSAPKAEINKSAVVQANAVAGVGTADELKKYKELLDSGVITQEDFDAKKKQLLGL